MSFLERIFKSIRGGKTISVAIKYEPAIFPRVCVLVGGPYDGQEFVLYDKINNVYFLSYAPDNSLDEIDTTDWIEGKDIYAREAIRHTYERVGDSTKFIHKSSILES